MWSFRNPHGSVSDLQVIKIFAIIVEDVLCDVLNLSGKEFVCVDFLLWKYIFYHHWRTEDLQFSIFVVKFVLAATADFQDIFQVFYFLLFE